MQKKQCKYIHIYILYEQRINNHIHISYHTMQNIYKHITYTNNEQYTYIHKHTYTYTYITSTSSSSSSPTLLRLKYTGMNLELMWNNWKLCKVRWILKR